MMGNSLDIIGNFMYEADAHLKSLNLLRSGRLDLSPIIAKIFTMTAVPEAMQAARLATSLECVVVRNQSN
jgi:alcohol dehydrogenase